MRSGLNPKSLGSINSKALHGVCAHCAASSRFVSRLGCLGECSDSSNSDEEWRSDSNDDWSGTDEDSCVEMDDNFADNSADHSHYGSRSTSDSSERENLPTAQSILSLFLGDRKPRHTRRLYRKLSRWPRNTSNDGSATTDIDASGASNEEKVPTRRRRRSLVTTPPPSDPESFKTCPRSATQSSNATYIEYHEDGQPHDSTESHCTTDHPKASPTTTSSSSSSSSVYHSPIHQHDHSSTLCLSDQSDSDDDLSCIMVSSRSLSSWSSSSSSISENADSNDQLQSDNEDRQEQKERQSENHVDKQEGLCELPLLETSLKHESQSPTPGNRDVHVNDGDDSSSSSSSPSSSYLIVPSGSELAGKSRRQSTDHTMVKNGKEIFDEERSRTNASMRSDVNGASMLTRRKRRNSNGRRRRVQSFRRVSKCVYRAMNCYKLLDLSKRGIIGKCPYTKDVCRVQVQLQCERNLAKGLIYFGFVAVCLPILPTPVVFSTTPPQRNLPEEFDEVHNKTQQQLTSKASSSMWLSSGPSWPLVGASSTETFGTSPTSSTTPMFGGRPSKPVVNKRATFAYAPPTMLLEQSTNWRERHQLDQLQSTQQDRDDHDDDSSSEDASNGGAEPPQSDHRHSSRVISEYQFNQDDRRRRYSMSEKLSSSHPHHHSGLLRHQYNDQQKRMMQISQECTDWFMETFEVSSWQSRNSLLSMAHNIVVQNSINQQRQQHESLSALSPSQRQTLLNIPRNGSDVPSQQQESALTTAAASTVGHRSISVPSFDIYHDKIGTAGTLQNQPPYPSSSMHMWPASSSPYATTTTTSATASTLPHLSTPWGTAISTTTSTTTRQQQHSHQMKMLLHSWSSSQSDFYLRDQHCPLERLYLKQQRQLAISAMDRQRALDESAMEEGRRMEGFTGLASLSPPQLSEYQLLDATLALPSLTPADKRLLWRHRETLQDQGVSVSKLAAAVDWTTTQQPKEFNDLLQRWRLPSIEGALELLSSLSPIPCVRHFACRALEAATESEICRYLPQLVQAIRYDIPGPNAPVLSVLLRRASICPRIASSLHWGFQCEAEDPEKGHLFIRGHQRLLETLTKTPEGSVGRRILKILELQRRFAVALRSLAAKIRDRKDRADRKTERLRELLISSQSSPSGKHEGSESLQLTNFQQPVPLPIAPYGLLLGIVPDKSHVVKSSQYPLALACRVLVAPSYKGSTIGMSAEEDDGDDDGDEYNDNDEIHALWEQEVVNVEELKERGYKEILKKYLFKTGDDLRQDQLVTQIIRIIKDLLAGYGSDYRLSIYDVVALSRNDGLVEFVDKSEAISSIKKSYPTLRHYFAAYSADSNGPLGFPKSVLDTFIRSCSGYSVITFLLGVGDRHLDNLLLCEDGRLFHVDFGFILGDDPKPFPPPMKLCSEMIEGLGGIGSEGYTTFHLMCCQCFRCIRRHSKLILDVLLMMAHSGIRALKTDPFNTIARVQEKFQLDLPEVEAEAFLLDIIGVSANALFPAVVDKFHEWALYWK